MAIIYANYTTVKYYIIAGEASGDLHASNLMKSISKRKPATDFRIWGGDLMEAAGGVLVKHYRDLAFMGFWEVVKNLRTILRNIRFCKEDILTYQPDALILVDYPGFNLRIAEWAKKQGIKVIYYISPQVWAWNTKRVHKIKRIVDKMLVILPFEKEFYQQYDYEVDFVGHPLLDAIEQRKAISAVASPLSLPEKPIIALLPGSRKQEIKRMLPMMLEMVDRFPDYQFIVAGAPSISEDYYKNIIQTKNTQILPNQTYNLLQISHAALVTSGTATLETALFGVPQVVCYQGNPFSFRLAKRLVKVNYISLVNLILDREVVKELIQDDFNPTNLEQELSAILNKEKRTTIQADYKELNEKLGGAGASDRAAFLVRS